MIRRSICLLPGILLVLLAGCSGTAKGTISGNVVFEGKPVTSGTVTCIASDNLAYHGAIGPGGEFTIVDVPAGPVQLGVHSPNPGGGQRQAAVSKAAKDDRSDALAAVQPANAGSWRALPAKFLDPKTSGLTGTVDGPTVINLNLK